MDQNRNRKMSTYAKMTNVSVVNSQMEIQTILRRYDADRFGTMEDKEYIYIMFEYNSMLIQIRIKKPNKDEYSKTPTGRLRSSNQIEHEYEQAIKQKWRILVLTIKAKLEAVESGISTLEQEFLAFITMPDGKSISDHLLPNLTAIASTGKMPKMLMAGSYGEK